MTPRAAGRVGALAAALLALALSACGGDEEPAGTGAQGGAAPERTTSAAPTRKTTASTSTEDTTDEETTSGPRGGGGEDQQGGAGDERPIASEVRLSARDGRISPRRVSVPPFIAVRLELRSEDGGRYGLRVSGRELTVGAGRDRDRVVLDGLTPGRSYVARPLGRGNAVRIVASSEPG